MRRRQEPVPVIGRWLGRVVRGYFNYYAVPGNMCRLNSFRSELSRAWRHALMRRSQRHRLPWSRFVNGKDWNDQVKASKLEGLPNKIAHGQIPERERSRGMSR